MDDNIIHLQSSKDWDFPYCNMIDTLFIYSDLSICLLSAVWAGLLIHSRMKFMGST